MAVSFIYGVERRNKNSFCSPILAGVDNRFCKLEINFINRKYDKYDATLCFSLKKTLSESFHIDGNMLPLGTEVDAAGTSSDGVVLVVGALFTPLNKFIAFGSVLLECCESDLILRYLITADSLLLMSILDCL